jgi:hypothetical protein
MATSLLTSVTGFHGPAVWNVVFSGFFCEKTSTGMLVRKSSIKSPVKLKLVEIMFADRLFTEFFFMMS